MTRPTWHLTALVVSAFLSLYTIPSNAQASDSLFKHYEVLLDATDQRTVLSGFLLSENTADLVTLHIDENDNRRLKVFNFDGTTWIPAIEATLSSQVLFVDVANIGGQDRLITFEPGRLNWFDPETATEQLLLETAMYYQGPATEKIPQIDITRDVNGDGLVDLVMPAVDGFWISTQTIHGSFTKPLQYGPPEPYRNDVVFGEEVSYGEQGLTDLSNSWYQSRVHQMDYNVDGLIDLAFWHEDHFEVHLQTALGVFSEQAKAFDPGVAFDSDGTYSLIFGLDDESLFRLVFGLRKSTKRSVLHSLQDINGDQITDLIVQSLQGRSMVKQSTEYRVHFGKVTPTGLSFEATASTRLLPHGRAAGLQAAGYASQELRDFNGDGQVDVAFRDVNVGIGGAIRAMGANSITIDLELYRQMANVYPDKPDASFKLKPALAPFSKRGPFFPAVVIGEVNGDRYLDLLVGKDWNSMHAYLGIAEAGMFAQHPNEITVALPNDERNIRLATLDMNNKQDLIVYPPSTDPHRLTILVAR